MTSKLVIGLAAATLGIGALGAGVAAQAQVTSTTTQHIGPNGGVHTTTTNSSAGGTKSIHTVDRPDGTRVVTRTSTDASGDTRTVKHVAGSDSRRVCRSTWRHGQRVRHCWMRHRS